MNFMSYDDPSIVIVDNVLTEAVNKGTLHLYATDEFLSGPTITVNGKELLNFGSCSYLGLEQNPRLKQGTIDAVMRYGTQFSASRAYLSAPPYLELEDLLKQIFNAYPLITASTTLGHLSTLPVLIGPKDAMIIDIQVHASVQLAANQCRLKGTLTEIIRHSQMEALEDTIKSLRHRGAKNIWYLADGIYSMYGDMAPMDEIISLLNKYDNFYLYIDDAHGISWTGKHGRGMVLGHSDIHPKMIVTASLNKSFATAGGAILFPNTEWLRKVRTCGGTLIFSGPIQPPMLGAAIASAKLHLSPEIDHLQKELQEKILYCNQMMEEYNLPLLSKEITPIRYIGLGTIKVVCNLAKRLMNMGYYTNIATFPAVAMKRGGLRVVINNLLKKEEIKGICQAISNLLPTVLEEENYSLDFNKTFGSAIPKKLVNKASLPSKSKHEFGFKITYETTIKNISQDEWNAKLGNRGSFNWEGLLFLEELFSNQAKPENNCGFHYYVIRDNSGEIILMTFFTTILSKDDIFSPASISEQVEQQRKERNDPYYFTSKVLMMGSLLSEGNHLYIDRQKDWQNAIKILIKQLNFVQEECKIEMTIFRDFPAHDDELHQLMLNQEYVKLSLPHTHIYENIYNDFMETVNLTSSEKRRFLRKEVLDKEPLYEIEFLNNKTRQPTAEELKSYYQLYLNVKSHGLEINVFNLPENVLESILKTDFWELIVLYLKETDSEKKRPVAIAACMKTPKTYSLVFVGLDYDYVKTHGAYRQSLYQSIKRGISLKAEKIFLGMTTSRQKKKYGVQAHEIVAYIQTTDNYKMEVLSYMAVTAKKSLTD